MSEFEIQDAEVMKIVNDNPRRDLLERTVGVIVPAAEARDFAEFLSAQKRQRAKRENREMFWYALAMLSTAAVAIVSIFL